MLSAEETEEALDAMKKDGFDYNLPILLILFSCFKDTLLLLLNVIFFGTYPIHLALSLLSILPKKEIYCFPRIFVASRCCVRLVLYMIESLEGEYINGCMWNLNNQRFRKGNQRTSKFSLFGF